MANTKRLVSWLKEKIELQGFNKRQTARAAGLSYPTILNTLEGDKPSLETCKALGNLFNTPPEELLRMAGLIPEADPKDKLLERTNHLMEKLSPDSKEKALEYLEFLITQEKKEEKRAKANRRAVEIKSS
ncbi:helix-turn-helix domain-containing protein [Chloroflexota bacterium]